jgi:alpha-glucuronidase
VRALAVRDAPKVALRMLDHWDNLDGSVERGYAGASIWQWDSLPAVVSPRYRDYARANASIGVNGAVVTNVNANARVLTPAYLEKVARIADALRPYGIRLYLTARFSAPIEIGGTQDGRSARRGGTPVVEGKGRRDLPARAGLRRVRRQGELRGSTGVPRTTSARTPTGRTCSPTPSPSHGGIVMWRAFVYSNEVPTDRVKQAYDEFKPLDGRSARTC